MVLLYGIAVQFIKIGLGCVVGQFVRTWMVNKKTGTIVITGHYDTNNNGKYDKTDKNEIGIYDLRTLMLISKI